MGKQRIVVTGANGLLGWHTLTLLHANNCAARFKSVAEPFDPVALDRDDFNNDEVLNDALEGAVAIMHFAGVNRAPDRVIADGNPRIAKRLIQAVQENKIQPHIVYANSIHSDGSTVYGKSKKYASDILRSGVSKFTDMLLPHVFGECARPHYNNVTATLIDQLLVGEEVSVNPDGEVQLLHAGKVSELALDAVLRGIEGKIEPQGKKMSVEALFDKILHYHSLYQNNVYPNLDDEVDLELFNTYRMATFPKYWPRNLPVSSDDRGVLFESVKSMGGGQTFLSTTEPGVTRGDHFHLRKVERFLVLSGKAKIRLRKVLTNEVTEFSVSGDVPAVVDMPTMFTHSIENTGDEKLLTLFWANEIFDPELPDTYADQVGSCRN